MYYLLLLLVPYAAYKIKVMGHAPKATLSLKIVLLSLFAFSAIVPLTLIADILSWFNLSNANRAYLFLFLYGPYFVGLLIYSMNPPETRAANSGTDPGDQTRDYQ